MKKKLFNLIKKKPKRSYYIGIGEIEKMYNVDFGVRSDMRLETLLKRKGYSSLNELIMNTLRKT